MICKKCKQVMTEDVMTHTFYCDNCEALKEWKQGEKEGNNIICSMTECKYNNKLVCKLKSCVYDDEVTIL